MADMMNFPKRWEDFLHDYEFEDDRRIYTNGSKLIPSFRVKQMMEHYACGEKRIIDNDVAEQCPECGNEVWLKWDVERDGYTIYCPYCGYRMKLCSMCDVRDGGKCDWNSDTGKCKNDKNGRTTKTAEPQPDGIQFRTVDDLGRICIPKEIRDKLGIKPGTECAVYATHESTSDEIIVIRRNKK